jgi:tetratricopeptide (TPR) repeat protein
MIGRSPLLGLVLLTSVPLRGQPAAGSSSFAELAHRADEARVEGRLEEATALYREALRERPQWAEGLFYLGTIAYDRDRFEECRDAFRDLCAVEEQMAVAWALRGLCEFRLADHEPARAHLERALALGLSSRDEMGRAVLYHLALLRVKATQFDLAISPLTTLLQAQPATAEVQDACGLVLLRRAALPSELPADGRGFVREVGRVYCALLDHHTPEAVRGFEALLAKYPRERHLHYGYGLALAQAGSPECVEQYRREIDLFPDDVLARVELGFALLTRGREKEAIPPAEEAVRLAPGLFATHLVLGRALVATGALERGIGELETAVQMAPRIPEIHLALARAYARAGRKAEAEEAREVFRSLDAARRGSPPPDESASPR